MINGIVEITNWPSVIVKLENGRTFHFANGRADKLLNLVPEGVDPEKCIPELAQDW